MSASPESTSTVGHLAVVANPTAGHGAGQRVLGAATAILRGRGVSHEVLSADTREESARLAEEAAERGADALLVVGGDGTVQTVLRTVHSHQLPLGILPAGTGNDAARMLDIPLDDVARAIAIILNGKTRRIDLGRASFSDGIVDLFCTIAATGFDAAVAGRAQNLSWPSGRALFALAALRQLPKLNRHHYQVRVDDVEVETDAAFTAIANGPTYGAGMRIAPHASADDGVFDIVMGSHPRHLPRLSLLRGLAQVLYGRVENNPLFKDMQGREVELYCDPPADVSLDGDIVGSLPTVFDILPSAIEVYVPH
ncbi:diacylglycerol kinase family lipid kinase [Gordonia sputi]|uniref:diacylglycerol/lipid kinase family protein n=1 Tax=Gordonia sputi TaxID=36823 RepID=UPI0020447354|nr:diacylglycerol kinase family protein [Gordonia sputi]MCM3896355.1 diacylglycerol kinase family lipid kinase [Gordonia sputi]